MGCGGSSLPKRTEQNTIRILSLGIGGCGKTTFAKQMKILHSNGFEDYEVDNFKRVIVRNIIRGLKECVNEMNENFEDIELENAKNDKFADFFVQDTTTSELDESVIKKAKSLWKDSGIQSLWSKISSGVSHFPHLDYFMAKIDEIAEDTFIPSNEDIVRCRQTTVGAATSAFCYKKMWWQLVDVGGQIPERAKWQAVVKKGITGIIFFSALDDYDTMSSEDPEKTKLEVSKSVWKEVINSEVFTEKCVCTLLFFNKVDLFQAMMKKKKLFKRFKKRFKKYNGDQKWEECYEYLVEIFMDEVNDKSKMEDNIYPHPTCALDTEQMSVVWTTLTTHVFQRRINDQGMGF